MANRVSKPAKAYEKRTMPAKASDKNEIPLKADESTEEPDINKKNTFGRFQKVSKTAALIVAIIICGSIALFLTLMVMGNACNIRASRIEYDSLREIADDYEASRAEYEHLREIAGENIGMAYTSAFDEEMRRINPDYICWIRIDGTGIDYPVVRGSDNERYLKTSFSGEEKIAGTIFMDYRNVGEFLTYKSGESLQHIIIYGHNLQRGGMFTDLRKFLNAQFLEENNIITLTANDRTVEFEIFSARLSDVNDPAYFLNFDASHSFPRFANRIDAPLIATQIITLSTCVSGGSDDARVIVQGYRLLD